MGLVLSTAVIALLVGMRLDAVLAAVVLALLVLATSRRGTTSIERPETRHSGR